MVYYLRPTSSYRMHSPSSHSNRYRLSPAAPSSESPMSMSSMSSSMSSSMKPSTMSSSSEGVLEKLTPYLVLTVIVAAVTAVVVLQGVKPSESCAKFLTTTDKDGNVVVSNLKVISLSLGMGLLVSLLAFSVHYLQPSLLEL